MASGRGGMFHPVPSARGPGQTPAASAAGRRRRAPARPRTRPRG